MQTRILTSHRFPSVWPRKIKGNQFARIATEAGLGCTHPHTRHMHSMCVPTRTKLRDNSLSVFTVSSHPDRNIVQETRSSITAECNANSLYLSLSNAWAKRLPLVFWSKAKRLWKKNAAVRCDSTFPMYNSEYVSIEDTRHTYTSFAFFTCTYAYIYIVQKCRPYLEPRI